MAKNAVFRPFSALFRQFGARGRTYVVGSGYKKYRIFVFWYSVGMFHPGFQKGLGFAERRRYTKAVLRAHSA